MKPENANSKLLTLEAGRAVAAILVVLHHASQATDAFASSHISHFFEFGMYGVDYFFVLSGFIIYVIHHDDPKNLRSAAAYASKRVRRIYIPYLPITLAMIAVYTFYPEFSQGNRDWSIFTSLTLLPSNHPPALSVAWTLVFEMIFYIFFLCYFFTRHFKMIVLAWTVLICVAWQSTTSLHLNIPFLKTMLDPMVLEFIAGGIAAAVFLKIRSTFGPLLVVFGIGALVLSVIVEPPHRFFYGLAIAPLVLGMALLEKRYRFAVPEVLLLLGSASYSIYLVHNPVQSVVARALQGFDLWWLTFASCGVVGVIVGIVFHKVYEKPALNLFSSIVTKRTQPAPLG